MTQWRLDQPHLRKEILARIPQNEIGTADDVASAVAFWLDRKRATSTDLPW